MVAPSRVRELKRQVMMKKYPTSYVAPSRVRELKQDVVNNLLDKGVAPSRVRELKQLTPGNYLQELGRTLTGA